MDVILETILSSISGNGKVNFAPIGVHVPDDCSRIADVKDFEVHLYPGSSTSSNLRSIPQGVINFTDDILSFVDTALYSDVPMTCPSQHVSPPTMAHAQASWEFTVQRFNDSRTPASVQCSVLRYEAMGTFCGFCRAQGAVLEALIAATRLQWVPASVIIASWPSWEEMVSKTGGRRELEAFAKVKEFLLEQGVPVPPAVR